MYMKYDKSSKLYEEMINDEQQGSLNVMVLLLCITAAAIALYESEGVYYALIGGNHVMHFRQSYWKKLVQGAIKGVINYTEVKQISILHQSAENHQGQKYRMPLVPG